MRAVSIPARAPVVPLRSRRLLALAGDRRLVEQVRRGNEAAFEVIFERHGLAILAFCKHMLGTREEAEDAVQHTFTAAYRDLQRGGDREIALKPWLFAIARNRCVSVLRAQREVPAVVDALELQAPSGAGIAEQAEERADLRNLVADLGELPDEQRAALLLTELGDLTHAEVAGVLGCEVSRVKGLVFRARSALIARREARETPCESIRVQLANLRGGALRRSELRLHLRECPGCRDYRDQVRQQRRMLAVALPVVPTLGLKSSVLAAIGIGGGSAGGLTAAAGGLGGATVAKVAVAGVLAGGGVMAGTAVVERERPAVAPPPATQGLDRAAPPAPDRGAPGAADRGPGYTADRDAGTGRRTNAGDTASPVAERAGGGTKRVRERTARAHGRGPVDPAATGTPVKRGPAATKVKPWKAERGNTAAPRGQAKGHAKGGPGPKSAPGAKSGPGPKFRAQPGPRANGRSQAVSKPNRSTKARPAPGPTSKSGPKLKVGQKPTGSSKANGSNRGLVKPPAVPKAKADAAPPAGAKQHQGGQTP
jgi:RNA polymerase sigma factor (sigma-70 family)